MPMRGHQIELVSGKCSQISTCISICGQVISEIRRLGDSIKEFLDIDFGSAGDDNLQPRSSCGCIGQDLQETCATLGIATLVKCVNNKDENLLRLARKGADEMKEERAFHRLWSEVWVVAKVFCYNGSKGGTEYGKLVGRMFMGSLKFGSSLRQKKAPARWFRS